MQKEKVIALIEASGYLPQLPTDISEILDILRDPLDVDIDLLIDKVSRSKELNDLMLKNINSGYYKLTKEIKNIRDAVVYLGMQAVQNLLVFFIILRLFPRTLKKLDRTFDLRKYFKHVLGTSVGSLMLAERIKKGDKYRLFTYGLIHDVGIIVLDTCLPALMDEIMTKLQNGVHQLVAERIVLGGLTHAEIGEWLLRKWNLREDFIDVVHFHHSPFSAKNNLEELMLLYVADVISTEYYQRLLGVNLNININNKVKETLGLTEDDIKTVIKNLPDEIDKVSNYFSVYFMEE
ncbi:MAG: HDOD domain-containing protein [Thermocaproicibacter melissae]|jgi:HD-like signal output (HDOD) protein|uniref:HDOD domain-containing protein n=1 Tax=Thermocaproicibacter melissae TaxID=2966552 RepID=UPI003A0FED4A